MKNALRTCRVCGIQKPFIRTPQKYGAGWKYVDGGGRPWNSKRCNACYRAEKLIFNHQHGIEPRSETHPDPRVQKAYVAESAVAEFFRQWGYHVETTTNKGPDLTVYGPECSFTVEVKSAYKARHANSWLVERVRPLRAADDLVAYVYPGGIYLAPMSEHLGECGTSGKRVITQIVRGGK